METFIASIIGGGILLFFFYYLHVKSTYDHVDVCGHCRHRIEDVEYEVDGKKHKKRTCPKCMNLRHGWYTAYVPKGGRYADKY